jgi:NitT/TauT family transport system substrate-binding protein
MGTPVQWKRRPAVAWAAVTVLALVLAACGGETSSPAESEDEDPGPSTAASAPAASEQAIDDDCGPVTIAITADSGVSVTPGRVAIERLQEAGYEVETDLYPDPITAMQAVIVGEAQVGTADSYVVIQANEAGQDFRIFAYENSVGFALVAPTSIESPEELDGMRVAYHSPGSFTRGLAFLAAQRHGFEPEWLVIEGSEVRAEALLNGQIDATVIDLEQTVHVQDVAPGDYHVLINFAEDFEGLTGTGIYSSPEWISQCEGFVRDYVAALEGEFTRVNEDRDYFREQILRLVGTTTDLHDNPEKLEAMIDIHLDASEFNFCNFNTPEASELTADIFVEIGDLESYPPIDEWATFEYVDEICS